MTELEIDEAEWQNSAKWHGGWLGLYYSRRDSRAFVPKRRQAMGVTINFAKPLGVYYLIGIFGFAALLFYLTRSTPRTR
jgi:uncharacterized membrane protein